MKSSYQLFASEKCARRENGESHNLENNTYFCISVSYNKKASIGDIEMLKERRFEITSSVSGLPWATETREYITATTESL
jgi:hypothetical protein